MDKQEEIWRPIKGYEGFYEVSNRGRVRSVDRWVTYADGSKRFLKGRILKPCRAGGGYLYVALSRDGKERNFKIHRLVAEAFIPNPENKPQINHLDEDKTNCSVENLSYCSAKENSNWGTRTKRSAASRSKAVLAIDPKTGKVVKEFPSTCEAGRSGFNQQHISACCRGERKTHKGLVWKFKDDYDQESAWTPVKIGGKTRPVQAINPNTGLVAMEFPSAMEAGRKGFTQTRVSACCRGEQGTHKGYRWRYKPVSDYSRMLAIYDIALEEYRKKTKTA